MVRGSSSSSIVIRVGAQQGSDSLCVVVGHTQGLQPFKSFPAYDLGSGPYPSWGALETFLYLLVGTARAASHIYKTLQGPISL